MVNKEKIKILKRKYNKFKSLENRFKNLNMSYDQIRNALDKLNDLYMEIVKVRNSNLSKNIKVKKIQQLSKKHNIPISNKNIHKLLSKVQQGGNEEPRFNMFKPIQSVADITSSYVPTGNSINASENIEKVVDILPLNQLITLNPIYQQLIKNIDGLAITDIFFPLYLFKELTPNGFIVINNLRLIIDILQWFQSIIEPLILFVIDNGGELLMELAPIAFDVAQAVPGVGTAVSVPALMVNVFNLFGDDLLDIATDLIDLMTDIIGDFGEILFYVSQKKFDFAFQKFTRFLGKQGLWNQNTLDIYYTVTQNLNETAQELSLSGKDTLLPVVKNLSYQLDNIEPYLESTLQNLEETTLPKI